MSDQCPSYISARSAEVILSDVRPIKLRPDALHAINVLLDEALYSILSTARSLATDRLKAALLKVLPTSLGKEALLEAEVELKAYWDRTGSARSPSSARHGETAAFDLQWSFELLRLKCEAYSTMNDSDEDAEAEKQLQHRMEAAGASSPPSPAQLAPAALYLTAILEAICEHVLSNVSRVAARDSSRTLASVQDLFTALGEDNTIYGMFKAMKVFAHIEALTKAQSQRPRRSKSISRSTDKAIVSRTSSSSPLNGESTSHAHTPSTSTVTGTVAGTASASGTTRSRMSTESQKSTVVGSSESRGASLEKAKGSKIFHSRTPSDKLLHHDPANSALARSATENGITRENTALEFEEDAELQQEFDELMRSGATMKVSLTPDRLKSMEVYKQERFERERLSRRGTTRGPDKPQDGHGASLPESKLRGAMNGRSLRHVDSIVEDEEESGSSAHASAPATTTTLSSPPSSARMRNISFTATTSTTTTRPANDQRLRSISISNVPHPRDKDGITRKVSKGARDLMRTGSQNTAPPPSSMGPAGLQKTRKKQVNLESMDLDDVLAGLEDDEDEFVEVRAPAKSASPTDSPRSPGGSKISKTTQDLIAFLDAGPPEDPAFNPSANASVLSLESSRTRSGRLQRMMSRLTLGGSKESLNGSFVSEDQAPKTPRTPGPLSRKNSKMAIASSPPPAFKSASLQSKRSIPNVNGAAAYPSVIVATPPPRPSVYTKATPQPVSAASSTSNEDTPSSQPSTLSRRNTRKAVPLLDDAVSPTSSAGHDSLTDGRSPTNGSANGLRVARVYDDSKLSSNPSPVRRITPIVDGHPVKLDTSEGSLRVADRKSPHPRTESGYASRSASRSPIGRSPAPSSPAQPPPPTISPGDAEEMRRLLGAATSAEECRLVVDLFLVKSGFPLKDAAPAAMAAAGDAGDAAQAQAKARLEDALAAGAGEEAEVERGHSLGERRRGTAPAGLRPRPRPLLQRPRPRESQSQSRSQSRRGSADQEQSQTGSAGRGQRSSNSSSRTFGSPVPFPAPISVAPDRTQRLSVLGAPTASPTTSTAPIVDRRLSVIVPRMSVDQHIVNLYRIYQMGLGLDRT